MLKQIVSRQIRLFSINKSCLVSSSQTIQLILKSNDEQNSVLELFSKSLDEIHDKYPSKQIATSMKHLYENNSSKFNLLFQQFENQRRNQIESFATTNRSYLIILLRYIRYLNISSIYRFLTLDVDFTLKQTTNSILLISNHDNYFPTKSLFFSFRRFIFIFKLICFSCLPLICELLFFVNYLCSSKSLSQIKSDLSKTLIIDYLLDNFKQMLDQSPVNRLLIKEFCSTLNSIVEIPKSNEIAMFSYKLLKHLVDSQSNEMSMLKYLIVMEHHRDHSQSSSLIHLFNRYLSECAIYEQNLENLCEILILSSSLNYSHELFHKHVLRQIGKQLKSRNEIDVELLSRLIYYLCLTDPTNRFATKEIILQLSQHISTNLNEKMRSPQWIIQAQHGMMLLNIYHYQLLFAIVQQQFFPLLFRDLGVYSLTIHRQLFDIHHSLICDRPQVTNRLLTGPMLEYADKISKEYRSSIESNQRSYLEYLNELNESFGQIYGQHSCRIIRSIEHIPNLIFDFLELNLVDEHHFDSIGINCQQRIALIPILKSMLIKQQRSNGTLVRILNAQTMMRCRIIRNHNYQVLTMFHDEFIRAQRRNQLKSMFETKLALRSLPQQTFHHI